MNTDNAYDNLVKTVRTFDDYAKYVLADEKRGLPTITNGHAKNLASTLLWNAESWMEASHRIQYAEWAKKELEEVALEAVACGACTANSIDAIVGEENVSVLATIEFDEEWFNKKAASIIRSIATEAMGTVYRGVESSSNPMTMLESRCKVSAAKDALEKICRLDSWRMSGTDAINDILSGIDDRAAKQEAEKAKKPHTLDIFKRDASGGGQYVAQALNHKGEAIDFFELNVSKKGEAKHAAQELAIELTRKHNTSIIIKGL